MLSLIQQIRNGALWDFPGGVHPEENKKQSNKTEIAHASIPSEIVLPVKQHIGRAGNLLVAVGEQVLKGQPLTGSDTGFTVPVHAPTSGEVVAIEPRTVAHPSGLTEPCIVIKPDGKDAWALKTPLANFEDETPEALIDAVRLAGISGMGGAGFPTAKKIQSGLARTEILIVNAAECEPYITADDTLMQFYADEVIKGIEVVEHILKPKLTIIGIEDNKPEAIRALEKAAKNKDIVIRVIPTKYPSGGEKQLIKILTNKEVPKGSIPADIGILVQNVGSLYAIKRAIIDGEPMVNRVVTLTGKTFKKPRNVWALLGTPVQSLLDEFGYKEEKKLPRLIMGGPMMGFTLPHSGVPITKTSNCILAPKKREISAEQYEMECIRCGQCAEACPVSLLPQQMLWYSKSKEYDKLEELNLKDCIECGACAYVCPSQIPLVQYYRQSKAEIRTNEAEAAASERAKQRFEAKNARMERDKAERENRFKKAATDRRKEMKTSGGDDAIAAAIARVKAQKASAKESEEPAVKPAVAAAIAKAKAKQAAAAQSGSNEPDNSEMAKLREERKRQARERKAQKDQDANSSDTTDDKKSAVAAAIARAKAKKAEQAGESAPESTGSKQDAVAAAVARAKARKAEQAAKTESEASPSNEDPRKAAIAAAVARAKARKAGQEPAADTIEDTPKQEASDPKKAAVAAAIARAKARKAAAEASDETSPEQESEDPKKAAVAAAIARAKARKAEKESADSGSEASSEQESEDPKKAAVAAAIARAKARKAEKEAVDDSTEDAPVEVVTEEAVDPKKAAVAAAIARAKARKAEKESTDTSSQDESTEEATEQEPEDPKKAAVAAAIARAKARKAEKEASEASTTIDPVETEVEPEPEDPKKAAVAAAIARAKARKAEKEAAEAETLAEIEVQPEQEPVDPKKAAVAAAIARAKARKAQKEAENNNKEND